MMLALSDKQRRMLQTVYRCRVLDTTQATLVFPGLHRRSIQDLMNGLAEAGFLGKVRSNQPGQSTRWICTPLGRQAVEADGEIEARPYKIDVHSAAFASHLIGVNDVGFAFSRWADEYGDDCYWDLEKRLAYSKKEAVFSDAVLYYTAHNTTGSVQIVRFVEFDRGTEPISQLVTKVRGYWDARHYTDDQPDLYTQNPKYGWQRTYLTFPRVLFVWSHELDELAAKRRTGNLAGALTNDQYLAGADLEVDAVHLTDLQTSDPFLNRPFVALPAGDTKPLLRREAS